MAEYSREDIASMQEDALRRVRDMQRQMKEKLGQSSQSASEDRTLQERQIPSEQPQQDFSGQSDAQNSRNQRDLGSPDFDSQNASAEMPQTARHKSPATKSPIKDLMKSFTKMDNDNLLILFLILLLQRENVDQTLILALFYIML